jgi:hypothetical protein
MSEFISAQTGPYMHSPALKFTKQFKNDKGGTRTFIVLFAGARNAGIIGSEDNGIVVLDDDNQCVMLDNHMQMNSGYFGPDAKVQTELSRIKHMDWPAFAEFCRDNPRFRLGCVPDIHDEVPDWRFVDTSKDTVLFASDVLARFQGSDYSELFPADLTRKQAENGLLAHRFHADGPYADSRLSWNIKVGTFDTSGSGTSDYPVNRYLDAAWAEQANGDSASLFNRACADGISHYVDEGYTTYPGDDHGNYAFGIEGRSGGHLVLLSVTGLPTPMKWGSQTEFAQYLDELTDAQLAKLVILVKSVDFDLSRSKINQEMAYQYASLRYSAETSGDLYRERTEELAPDDIAALEVVVDDEPAVLEIEKATGLILTPPEDRPIPLATLAVVDISQAVLDEDRACLKFPQGLKAVKGFDFNKEPCEAAIAA